MGKTNYRRRWGLLLLLLPLAVWSDDEVRVGRYSSLAAYPTPAQRAPLATVVTVRFPPAQVSRVGEAVQYLLQRSGYRFVYRQPVDPNVTYLMALPLPEVHRHLGPLPLERALSTLAGERFQLLVQPVRREVSFALRPDDRQGLSTSFLPAAPGTGASGR